MDPGASAFNIERIRIILDFLNGARPFDGPTEQPTQFAVDLAFAVTVGFLICFLKSKCVAAVLRLDIRKSGLPFFNEFVGATCGAFQVRHANLAPGCD